MVAVPEYSVATSNMTSTPEGVDQWGWVKDAPTAIDEIAVTETIIVVAINKINGRPYLFDVADDFKEIASRAVYAMKKPTPKKIIQSRKAKAKLFTTAGVQTVRPPPLEQLVTATSWYVRGRPSNGATGSMNMPRSA